MTEQRIKSFPVSWEELHRTSKALAWRLLELGPFKGLIALLCQPGRNLRRMALLWPRGNHFHL